MRKLASFLSCTVATIAITVNSARAQNEPQIDSGPYINDVKRAADAGYIFKASPDRADGVYHAGDPVRFTCKLLDKDKKPVDAEVKWSVSKDSLDPKGATTRPSADGSFTVDGDTLNQPGFIQFEALWTPPGASRMLQARAAAAFDREQIKPSIPEAPDDFDAFWSNQRAKLAAVPMNIRMTPVKQKDAAVEVFDVQADIGDGAVMSGYFARPVNAKPKSLPAIVFGHGAGVASSRMDIVTEFAKKGMLAFDFNAHGIANGQPPDFYAKLRTGELKEYQTRGKDSRDTIYFRTVFLRGLRAVDVLTQQPEWDGRRVIANGRSQGGAIGLALGGIDPRVTCVVVEIPGMCDHTGILAGRMVAWPRFLPASVNAKQDPKVVEAIRYYDATNFATRGFSV